jgi:SAM-dependent methyltransferase
MANDAAMFGPEHFLQLHMSMIPARVISSAVRFEVFGHLAAGLDTAPAVARAAGATERGIRMLLDALCALSLATKHHGRYQATEPARRYLARSSPDYLGSIMETDELWEAWAALPEVIRTGQPAGNVDEQAKAEAFFPKLVQSLHVVNREPARRAAAALGAAEQAMRVLDLACGSGVWGIAIAEAHPEARITAQDFPGILNITRRYVERHGLTERFEYLPGDLKTLNYPPSAYDVAILGNIVHSAGEASSRELFRRLHGALRPGGRIVIIDMIPNDERTGPPYPVFFALNMLVNTREGHAGEHPGGGHIHACRLPRLAERGRIPAARAGGHRLALADAGRTQGVEPQHGSHAFAGVC